MIKRRVVTSATYKPKNLKKPPKKDMISCTMPGQETKLRKILEQHSRGMALPQDKEGQYFGDLDIPDFEAMDLVEVMEYTKGLTEDIRELKQIIRAQQEKSSMESNQVITQEKPVEQEESKSIVKESEAEK